MSAMPIIEKQSPPFRMGSDGTVRIGSSRITLDLVVEAYELGISPESFAASHDSVTLAEVYATVAYYLAHKEQLDPYLQERNRRAEELQVTIDSEPGYREWRDGVKEKLLRRVITSPASSDS